MRSGLPIGASVSSGDYTQQVTRVPIPNTTVKLLGPMIVPTSAKVGYRRIPIQTSPFTGRGFFVSLAFLNRSVPVRRGTGLDFRVHAVNSVSRNTEETGFRNAWGRSRLSKTQMTFRKRGCTGLINCKSRSKSNSVSRIIRAGVRNKPQRRGMRL